MEPWENDPWSSDGDSLEDRQDSRPSADEIYGSIQRSRAIGDIIGESSGRGILGDAAADWGLARDIESGMSVRDALEHQRGIDYLMGDRRSNGILSDMLTDDLIAQDVENGMDIGEAIAREQAWADFWDDMFNG